MLARQLGPAPALLHAGRGDGWWWDGAPIGSDGTRTWTVRRTSATSAMIESAPASRILWSDPRTVLDEGFVYRAGRPVATVLDRERVWAGPGGAVLIGGALAERGGPPGRSVRPLPCALQVASVRWSEDGAGVAGRDAGGHAVVIDLRTMRHDALGDVEPVAPDAWIDSVGRLVRRGRTVLTGLVEASPAVWGEKLAGPGGLVWSLATGRPISRRRSIALGCTVGTPDGFVTVDWRTNELRTVPPRGRGSVLTLPIDPEDTVVAGTWADGAVHLTTAGGEHLRLHDGRVEPGDRAVPLPESVLVETPAGRWSMSGTIERGGHHFAWTDDGWLLSWP